ncbi:phenylacetate--CoA ligase family protein [Fusobacterium mortiferum]|uniref:phenylacetate--CoA ligase family protein n=1 Tax=Fusobacterium mortiferum TaxID=850 RepID=UPI0015887724|nr:phenylacetate--CoA ligase family protein [Fusobacterium mortiferum]
MKIKKIIGSYIPNSIRYGRNYSKYLKELESLEKMTIAERKEWQLKKLNEILMYSYENIPHYKELFDEKNINLPIKNLEEIKNIPILTKEEIRKNYNKMISQKKIKSFEVNTGGSTGTPLKLLKSKDNRIKEIVFLDYYMQNIGIESFKCRKAIIRGPIPKKGISEKIGNELILSSYLISKDTIKEYIRELEKFNPEILHVYPSSIFLICKLIKKEKLNINIPNLKVVFSSSETFDYQQKELVNNIFKCKIFDLYGNTENTVHGINLYPNKGYSFNEFYSFVEIINDEIITTSFNELAMPLIRYKTGDEIEYLDQEKKIFRIKGRVQDYIYGKNKEKYPVVGIIFGQHFSSFKDIDNFQIYQNELGKIEFIVEGQELLINQEKEIIKTLEHATKKAIKVTIKYVKRIERTNRGKYKFLIQELREDY